MSRKQAAPETKVCTCQSMVNLVPYTDDHSVMIPVDVDRDPDGGLVIVGSRSGHTVRPVRDGEVVDVRLRRRAHWDTCPNPSLWKGAMVSVGVIADQDSSHDATRIGPCARCRQRHPWHYGGPVASPVCDRCRAEDGMALMGEYD